MADRTLLVGDVGGTNARFAIARRVDGRPVLGHHESFPAERHPTFHQGVAAFLDGCAVKPTGGVKQTEAPSSAVETTWRKAANSSRP